MSSGSGGTTAAAVRTECAQKNGRIDESSNEDKERIDPIYLEKSATQELNEYDKVLSIVDNINIDDDMDDEDDDDDIDDIDDDDGNDGNHVIKKDTAAIVVVGAKNVIKRSSNEGAGADDDDTNDIMMIDNTEPTDIDSVENKRSTLNADATMMDLPDDKLSKTELRDPNENGCSRLCKSFLLYKGQCNSVSSGLILFIITGFQIIWALYYLGPLRPTSLKMIPVLIIVYYVAAIVGSIIGALLITVVRKKILYDISAVAAAVCAVLFILAHSNEILILFGRILAGLVHGILYITTIIHSAENASKNFRHILLLTFGYNFGLSVAAGSLLYMPLNRGVNPETLIGTATAVIAFVGVICTRFLVKESPLYLLQQQRIVYEEDLSEAYDTFTSLHKKMLTPDEIQKKFDEAKLHFADEMSNSQNIFTDGNFKTLFLCLCARLVGVLSFNLPLVLHVVSSKIFEELRDDVNLLMFTIIVWFIGGMFMLCLFHQLNKKHSFYIISVICGICLTLKCVLIVSHVQGYMIKEYIPHFILSLYFFLISLPMEMISTLYLSEAFIVPKKPFSIAIITTFEHLLHILLIVLYENGRDESFWIITGLGLIGLSVKVYWSLPRKTNGLTLHQSVNAFKNATVMEWYSQANVNSRCVV